MNIFSRISCNLRSKVYFPRSMASLYPWLIWFLASSFIFYKYLLQVSPSVMMPELMRTFDLTGEAMGSLAAFYFYSYLVMQLPVGILLDRFNPRYLICGAILVCSFGAYLFSNASELSTAELGRSLIGIGGAFSAVGAMKLISLWFSPEKFALVSGLMMSMAMLGAIGGEAPLSYLVGTLGWRHAMQLCAFGGILLALLVYLLIKDKGKFNSESAKFNLGDFVRGIISILKNKQSWLISIYSGLAFAPVSAFAGLWGIPFILQKYHLDSGIAAGLVSIAFVGFAVGAPFAGWLSDRIKRRKPIMVLGTTVSLIALSLIIYVPLIPYLMLAILFFIFGCFSGFFFISFAHIREINDPLLSGTSIGFINMFDALFGALSEPLIGKLLDLRWHHQFVDGARSFSVSDYQSALILLPVAMVIGLLLQLVIKETHCKQR